MSTREGQRVEHPYSYGLKEHKKQYGNGQNRLRTTSADFICVQPAALRVGDKLGTGEIVAAPNRDGHNGRVIITLQDGMYEGKPHLTELEILSRLPIAVRKHKSK